MFDFREYMIIWDSLSSGIDRCALEISLGSLEGHYGTRLKASLCASNARLWDTQTQDALQFLISVGDQYTVASIYKSLTAAIDISVCRGSFRQN